MNRSVSLSNNPQRIISLVPSQTELLYDLGLGDRVVGITKFCIHPEKWRKEKTIIGGTKNFRFDVIDSLKPDLIIGNKEENFEDGINQLAEKHPVWMSDIFTLEDSLKMINLVGNITNTSQESSQIVQCITTEFNHLPSFQNKTVAYFIWKDPYMVVGNDTFIDNILSTVGLKNVFADKPRYFKTSPEEINALKPDYIFLSSEPFPFKENNCEFFRNLLPQTTVKVVDGEVFSWYGSRLKHSPKYFKELYEEIKP